MEVRRNRRFDVGQKVELLYNPIQKLTNGNLGVSTSNYADESFLIYGQYAEDYNDVNISANDVIATPYFGGRVSDTYYNNVTIGLPYDAFGEHSANYLEGYSEIDAYVFEQKTNGYWYCLDGSGYKEEGQQPNLVTNGTFDTDSDWNGTGSNNWSINTTTKKLVASNVVDYNYTSQDVGITDNGEFRITFDATVDSGELFITTTDNIQSITSSNSYSFYFTGDGSENGNIYFKGNGFTGTIDNVVVEEVKIAGDNNRIPDAYISNVKLKTNNKTFGYGEQLFQNNWEDVVTVQVPASTPEWKLQQLVNSTATAIKGNSDLYNVIPDESEYENTYDTEYGTDVTTTSDWSDITNYNYYKQFGGGSCSPIVRLTNIDKPSIKYNKRKNTISIDLVLLG